MDNEVIGIWYQPSHEQTVRTREIFGHILLLKDNQLVYWCWRESDSNQVCMTRKTVTNTHLLTTVSVRSEAIGQLHL